MELLILISLIFIVYFLIPYLKNKSKSRSLNDKNFEWPTLNKYCFDIVGESSYQDSIKKICDDQINYLVNLDTTKNSPQSLKAKLIPEDSNKYDNKAIRVDINGLTVGYFDRKSARNFRSRLSSMKLTGKTTICDALVIGGGTKANGEKLHYGIRLDIEPFDSD